MSCTPRRKPSRRYSKWDARSGRTVYDNLEIIENYAKCFIGDGSKCVRCASRAVLEFDRDLRELVTHCRVCGNIGHFYKRRPKKKTPPPERYKKGFDCPRPILRDWGMEPSGFSLRKFMERMKRERSIDSPVMRNERWWDWGLKDLII